MGCSAGKLRSLQRATSPGQGALKRVSRGKQEENVIPRGKAGFRDRPGSSPPPGNTLHRQLLEHFQFETLCVSNHTACRFAEKACFFHSLRAGRRCAAASRFTFFKSEMLYPLHTLQGRYPALTASCCVAKVLLAPLLLK